MKNIILWAGKRFGSRWRPCLFIFTEVRSVISSAVFLESIKETWKRWCMTVFGLCLIQLLLILSCVPTGKSILLNLEEYFLDPVLQLVSLKLSDPSVSGTLTTVFFGFWVLLLPTIYTLCRAEELVAEGMESGRLISYTRGSPWEGKRDSHGSVFTGAGSVFHACCLCRSRLAF